MKKRKATEWKVPHIFHTSPTFMDYLHGDVAEREAFFACLYEYARESKNFWEAALKRDESLKHGQRIESAAYSGWAEVSKEQNNLPSYAGDFLRCPSFPKKDWQELSADERKRIMQVWPNNELRPLQMPDVGHLKSRFIFEGFTKMLEDANALARNEPPGNRPKPMKRVLAILQRFQSHPYFYVVFLLDFSKAETQLVKEFQAWLRLPDNQARLEKFKKSKVGKTGEPLDRLKDLAASRLFRELNNDWNAANNFANGHRKREKFSGGGQRPFHNARRQAGQAATEADLFGGDADARKVKRRISRYLQEIMPLEFHPSLNPSWASP